MSLNKSMKLDFSVSLTHLMWILSSRAEFKSCVWQYNKNKETDVVLKQWKVNALINKFRTKHEVNSLWTLRHDVTHDTIWLIVTPVSLTATFSHRFREATLVKRCSRSTLFNNTQHKNPVKDQQTYQDDIAWERGREWSQPELSRYKSGGKAHQDVRAKSHKTRSYSGFSG